MPKFLSRFGRHDDPGYLVLVEEPPPAPIRMAFSTDADGYRFFPAFTSQDTLLRWKAEGGLTHRVPLSTLLGVLAESPMEALIIDPADRSPKVYLRSDVLAGRRDAVQAGTRQPPRDIPER
jgi:hypothetical protein